MDKQIRLAGIAPQSLVNGQGMRKVYFSQGCTHHCKNCFNPETWPFEGGQLFDMDELLEKLSLETYLDGVTFSGGDPFMQQDKFAYMAEKIHKMGFNIWSYTGYTFEKLLELAKTDKNIDTMLKNIDVIVDGRFVQELHVDHLKFRGSTNQRIIDVQKSLATGTIVVLPY